MRHDAKAFQIRALRYYKLAIEDTIKSDLLRNIIAQE